MRTSKNILTKILCTVMVFSMMAVNLPGKVAEAAWYPDHTIPAYQQKDVYETETVTVSGVKVEEVTNSTTHPIQTKSINEPVNFTIYNSTTQEIEQKVKSENGKLPDLNLIKNHNYIIFAEDSEYRMPNVYVWVKDGRLLDIKHYSKPNGNLGYVPEVKDYPEVSSLQLYKRTASNPNPADDRRVTTSINVRSEGGGPIYGVKFKLVSAVETIEVTCGADGSAADKIITRLLEDVNYMVTVESDQWDIASFPVVFKDKSEYGAGVYTYDHSSCAQVDEVKLVAKGNAHKNDTVLTNTNYGEIYKDIYENIAGNTTITGLNFKDFLVVDKKIDKQLELDGDYDVFDIKVVNPHRWEVAKLAAGEYKVTEKIDAGKQAAHVYYIDSEDKLQEIEFKQAGNEVTFAMNSLSLYPVVIEYGEDAPDFDNTTMNIKVVDQNQKPVEGLKLYLKSTEYENLGDIKYDSVTDADGKLVIKCTNQELSDDEYELRPVADSGYTCESPRIITFDSDDGQNTYIYTIDEKEYTSETGEITLVVKKEGSEPVEPDFDNTTMNIKVVDQNQKPVEGLKLYLKSTEYENLGDIKYDSVTDADGKLVIKCTNQELSDDEYELRPVADSGYTCESPRIITFDSDDGQNTYIYTVDEKEYTSETGEITLVVKKEGGEPVEPEFDNQTLNIKVVDKYGRPVSDVQLEMIASCCVKTFPAVTNSEGKASYKVGNENGTYKVQPTADSGYTCESPAEIVFAQDSQSKEYYIQTANGEDFKGQEVKIVVKKVETEITEVISSITETGVDGDTATITVKGTALPEDMYYMINYKKQGQYAEEEWPAVKDTLIKTEGTSTERTFTLKLPAVSEYQGALKWRVGVATTLADGYTFIKNEIVVKDTVTADTKKALEEAINGASQLNEADYTAESWQEYIAAIEAAKTLVNNEDATNTECLNAIKAIDDAKSKLEKKSNADIKDPDTDNKPGDKDNKPGDNNSKPSTQNQKKAPKTGDTTTVLPFVIGILAAMAVILAFFLKKKRSR